MPSERFIKVGGLSLLLLAVALFLAPLLEGDFITDDYHLLHAVTYGVDESTVLDPQDPTAMWCYFYTPVSERYQLYRPLVALSLRLSYDLSGLEPRGFILSNLLLHLLNTVMVALFTMKLCPSKSPLPWLIAASIFALHPFQTQVIAWSAARSDSLSFFFGSMALYLKWTKPSRTVVPAILAFLALICKESAAVWFFVLVCCDLWTINPGKNGTNRTGVVVAAKRAIPLFVLGLGYMWLRWNTLGVLGGGTKYMGEDLDTYVANNSVQFIRDSLTFALSPISRVVLQDIPYTQAMKMGQGIGTISILILGTRVLLKQGAARTLIVLLILVFPLALVLPVSPLGPDFANTRGFYTPLFAIGLLAGLATFKYPRLGLLSSCLLVAGFLPTTWALQERWLEAGESIRALRQEIVEVTKGLAPEDVNHVIILNYTREESNKDNFGFSELSEAAIMRPFTQGDFKLSKVSGDYPVAGLDFLETLPQAVGTSARKTAFFEMFQNQDDKQYRLKLLHAGALSGTKKVDIVAISPLPLAKSQMSIHDVESRTPRFRIRHPRQDNLRFRIDVLACKGLVLELPVAPSIVSTDGNLQTTEFTIPTLPVEMVEQLTIPRYFAWSITVSTKEGEILGRSPMQLFISSLKTE